MEYKKFKTPFYEIDIFDSTGKRHVSLPHHILRLVTKVEFTEVWDNKMPGSNVLTLEFIEGSREPASPDVGMRTKGLYKLSNTGRKADMHIAGSITNRPGAITDLRFSGDHGITFLTEAEARTTKISDEPLENVNDDIVTRLHPKEDTTPVFLFQENNIIKLTWGYREDLGTVRSETLKMKAFKVTYPQSNQIRTTVICHDSGIELDNIVPSVNPVLFASRNRLRPEDGVEVPEDLKMSEILTKISNDTGIDVMMSPSIPLETLDTGYAKVWYVGQSFYEFMADLARTRNAVFKAKFNSVTGEELFYFIDKEDLKKIKVDPPHIDAFTYKVPGSIIKSLDINADFSKMVGAGTVYVDNNGNPTKTTDQVGIKLFKNQKKTSAARSTTLPSETSAAKAVTKLLGIDQIINPRDEFVTVPEEVVIPYAPQGVNATPSIDAGDTAEEAKRAATIASERTVSLSMRTLGHTSISVGTVEIRGLGVRYSGEYQLRKVVHTINNKGYGCSIIADTFSTPTGGTLVDLRENEEEEVTQTRIQLFESQKFNRTLGHKKVTTKENR